MLEFILTVIRLCLHRSSRVWRGRREIQASILIFFTFLFLDFLQVLILLGPCLGLVEALKLWKTYFLLTGISPADMTTDIHGQ